MAFLGQLLGDAAEVDRDLAEEADVKAGVVLGALEGRHHRLGGRLGRAVAQRGQRGVDDVRARLNGLEVGHVAGAGGVMGVHVDRHFDRLLELLDQAVGLIRQEEVGHILDRDGVRAHLLQLDGHLHEVVLVVHGADRVAHGRLADAAVFLGGLHGGFHVAGVVERVKNADDVDAVFDRQADELVHHVVAVVLVTQDVLTAQQHLQLGLGHGLAQRAQPLPRILVQEAKARVKRGAAPAFQRIVADSVQLLSCGEHILEAHPRRGLRLVRVAQNGVGNEYLAHGRFPPRSLFTQARPAQSRPVVTPYANRY